MAGLNVTHDPGRRSWVDGANDEDADFPIQNLPYGAFSAEDGPVHIGVAIGSRILDLTALEAEGLLRPGGERPVFDDGVLNPFMALPKEVWRETRAQIADMLDENHALSREEFALVNRALIPASIAKMHLPFFVRSYTDFYASKEHATNVGSMFRDPKNALMSNWLHIPIGYNGRASTVIVSGTEVIRPMGQLKGPQDEAPRFGPCEKLDIELELGAVVGSPTRMGDRLTTAEASDAIFGYVLLNDWSARDIQTWEYQPLGPFQSKAFATTIGPWVVTTEALEPFRVPTPDREVPLLDYLREDAPYNFGISLGVDLGPEGAAAETISRTNYRYMYYSAAQQLAHHASSGCAMCTGDLLGSGTISGQEKGSYGSLLELTWNGTEPLDVGGQERAFLKDGDTVCIAGWCERKGARRIGFGTCDGRIAPAR